MKAVARFSLAALALGLMAAPASAQLSGLPVVYAPASTGITIGGMYGRGLNDDSGKLNSAGGMVTIGLPAFQVSAGASYYGFGGDFPIEKVSFGGNAGYKLPLPPSTPVTLMVVAGVGYVSPEGGSILTVPAGLTLGINVPATSVSVTPWVSPQFRYTRISPDVGDGASESSFGVSGGLSVGLPVGVGIDLAVDWNRIPADAFGDVGAPSLNQITIGAGLHYTIKTPSLGGGGM
jgi:hypothetical protein